MNFFNEIIDEVSKVGNEISDTQNNWFIAWYF